MENTTRDFKKIISDYKVSAIVMLCELEENGEVWVSYKVIYVS